MSGVGLVVLLLLLALGMGGAFLFAPATCRPTAPEVEEEPDEPGMKPIQVKTVQPRQDRSFMLTVQRPADVKAYYRVEIEARVAGEVSSIRVADGTRVTKGETLVKIYVPDLEAAEREKFYFVGQRERELSLGIAKTEAAKVAVKTAIANVDEKKTLLRQAQATMASAKHSLNGSTACGRAAR